MASNISANDIRVDGELKRLYWGLAIVALPLLVISFFLSVIPIVVVLLLVSAFLVWIVQANMLGNMMKVSAKQFPEILELAEEAAARLSMARHEIFVTQHPVLNAYAMGFIGRKSLVLHSALVEGLEPKELQSVIGHEFTHIKCNHTNLLVLTRAATNTVAEFRVPVLDRLLSLIFLPWCRSAEYTCDRGGLLACRDLRAAIKAEAKLVVGPALAEKLDIDSFIRAGEELDKSQFAKFAETLLDHPYSVKRVIALIEYFHSPDYQRIGTDLQLGHWDSSRDG